MAAEQHQQPKIPPQNEQGGDKLLAKQTKGTLPAWICKHQHGCFVRRRAVQEREGQTGVRPRKPYTHESRHQHAKQRLRGPGGQFLKKLDAGEALAKASSSSNRLQQSNQDILVQGLNPGLQTGESSNSQSRLVQNSNPSLSNGEFSNLVGSNQALQRGAVSNSESVLVKDSHQGLPNRELGDIYKRQLHVGNNTRVHNSNQGSQDGGFSRFQQVHHFGEGTSSNQGWQDGGFSRFQQVHHFGEGTSSNQGWQDGGFSNFQATQHFGQGVGLNQSLQHGRLSNLHESDSSRQGVTIQGLNQTSQTGGLPDSQSRLVQNPTQGSQNGELRDFSGRMLHSGQGTTFHYSS